MPRTLQEILDHQDEIADRFEQYEPKPGDWRDPAPLASLREAVTHKTDAEADIARAISEARDANYSWAAIGALLGTTGEAARQRYGQLAKR